MTGAQDIRTARLRLRPGGPDDVRAMHHIASDFDVVRYTGTWPWPADRDFTASRCQPLGDKGLGGIIALEDRVIGMASIFGEGELGYMLARDAWGQGYATEVCRALVEAAFASGRWDRLQACVFMDNPGSARVLGKLGFVEGPNCEGTCVARNQILPTRTFTLDAPRG